MATKALWRLPLRSILQLKPSRARHYATVISAAGRNYSFITSRTAYYTHLSHHHDKLFMTMRFQRPFASSSVPESSTKVSSTSDKPVEKHDSPRRMYFRDFMSSVPHAPVVPMVLGVTGAIPFLVLTPPFPYVLPLPELLAANPIEAQTLYGAVILTFLGAPHWGIAMAGIHSSSKHKILNQATDTVRYVWSVVPSLIAWPALMMSTVPRLQLLICSFGLVFTVDVLFGTRGLLPPWYLPLRMLLSGIVILCLTASLFEVIIMQKLEEKKEKNAIPSS